jgi:fibrillarin-like rRNA methylase
MKQYQSTVEGVWVEFKSVELTDEERSILASNQQSDQEAKEQLIQSIKSRSIVLAGDEESSELTAIYNSNKPELKESNTYELISVNVDSNFNGIINCRINGNHTQVRF